MTDIVDRLTEATGFALMDAARQTLRDAIAEIRRLRGELVLWKAAATLTRDERQVLEQAIASATLVGTEDQVRRLRWLLERLTFPVPEPKEKLAEVSDGLCRKADENSGRRATLTPEERHAVETAALEAEAHQHTHRAATLRGLLERLA